MLKKLTGWTAILVIGGLMVGAELLKGVPFAKKGLWALTALVAVVAGYQEVLG